MTDNIACHVGIFLAADAFLHRFRVPAHFTENYLSKTAALAWPFRAIQLNSES
jgi:hypothetical protein